jgi:IclR family acetate operon transcriptional repressor
MAGSSAETRKGPTADERVETRTVRSVERAARIMQALFLATPRGMRVSELSRELGLHKTTVLRLIRTLQGMNLLRKDERTECYAWEPLTWLTMLNSIKGLVSPVGAVQETLDELAQAAGETVVLGYPDPSGRNMGIAARSVSDKAIRVDPGLHRMPPMHCTAAGKAYLTRFSAADLRGWSEAGLPALTEHTITSPEKLLRDIAEARERGYAVTREECIPRTAGIGVPVRDDAGTIVGGLQVCVPAEALTQRNTSRWVELLTDSGKRITQVLYAGGAGDFYRDDANGRARAAVRREPDRQDDQSGTLERRPYRLV